MFIRTVGLWFSCRVSLALVGWLHELGTILYSSILGESLRRLGANASLNLSLLEFASEAIRSRAFFLLGDC